MHSLEMEGDKRAAQVNELLANSHRLIGTVLLGIVGSLVGGVIGAQAGAAAGKKLKAAQLRLLLALVVLAMAGRLVYDLYMAPKPDYRLEEPG